MNNVSTCASKLLWQIAVAGAVAYLCHHAVTRSAGNTPEHYVAHVMWHVCLLDSNTVQVNVMPKCAFHNATK